MDQLKHQYKYDELMGSLSSITAAQMDKLAFVTTVVLRLSHFNLLVNQAHRSGETISPAVFFVFF